MTNNIERIGDELEDIAAALENMIEEKLYFSEYAITDYVTITSEASEFLRLVLNGINNENREIMAEALRLVNNINRMSDDMKAGHHDRLFEGTCEIDRGMIFIEILDAFEKMGGFCYNLAQAVAGVK